MGWISSHVGALSVVWFSRPSARGGRLCKYPRAFCWWCESEAASDCSRHMVDVWSAFANAYEVRCASTTHLVGELSHTHAHTRTHAHTQDAQTTHTPKIHVHMSDRAFIPGALRAPQLHFTVWRTAAAARSVVPCGSQTGTALLVGWRTWTAAEC